MNNKKIAFCKFAGMANGGIEKYLQSLAIVYKNGGHLVDFYYTNCAPIVGTSWQHPDNDDNRIKYMRDNAINLIEIKVDARNDPNEYEWINTDFFDKFQEDKYDYIVTGGNGVPEYPYNKLSNIKIIHTVHGDNVFNKSNIHKSIILCKWQSDRWLRNGGDSSKLTIIPSLVWTPKTWSKNLREKLNLPKNAFVYGFHQRNDDDISSTISLQAFSRIQNDETFFIILGGGNPHREFVQKNQLRNVIFLDYTSDVDIIHEFLDGIDVYTHCRNDGEVCSASIIEAMSHSKPVISYPGVNMGHIEQLEGCGKVTYSVEEYASEMKLLQDLNYRKDVSQRIYSKYNTDYRYEVVKEKLLGIIGI